MFFRGCSGHSGISFWTLFGQQRQQLESCSMLYGVNQTSDSGYPKFILFAMKYYLRIKINTMKGNFNVVCTLCSNFLVSANYSFQNIFSVRANFMQSRIVREFWIYNKLKKLFPRNMYSLQYQSLLCYCVVVFS